MKVTLNKSQRLYVLNHGKSYSCLGFDVAKRRSDGLSAWLGVGLNPHRVGSLAFYRHYLRLIELARKRHESTGEKCLAELSPQLKGLEGYRVEVQTLYGETRRFIVGRSTGWIPIHLEVRTRRSMGGGAAENRYFSVRVLERVR